VSQIRCFFDSTCRKSPRISGVVPVLQRTSRRIGSIALRHRVAADDSANFLPYVGDSTISLNLTRSAKPPCRKPLGDRPPQSHLDRNACFLHPVGGELAGGKLRDAGAKSVASNVLLRWAGSKRSCLAELAKNFPTKPSRYIEPFCGSAALFFHLNPQHSILSDVNSALISFYKAVRRAPDEVYDLATSYPRTRRAYYNLRERFKPEKNEIDRAALFYYLNKNCFNGLYRTSKIGEFNVPFSPLRTGRYPPKGQFVNAALSFKRTKLISCDFEQAIRMNCQSGDFIFLDPPYSDAKRYPFREYYPGCFCQADVKRLLGVLHFIQQQNAFFVLTFSNRLGVDFSRTEWRQYAMRMRRNISGFASARRYVEDVVVTNVRA